MAPFPREYDGPGLVHPHGVRRGHRAGAERGGRPPLPWVSCRSDQGERGHLGARWGTTTSSIGRAVELSAAPAGLWNRPRGRARLAGGERRSHPGRCRFTRRTRGTAWEYIWTSPTRYLLPDTGKAPSTAPRTESWGGAIAGSARQQHRASSADRRWCMRDKSRSREQLS
jgi:hypothetical protein